jgi:hypothetical protein
MQMVELTEPLRAPQQYRMSKLTLKKWPCLVESHASRRCSSLLQCVQRTVGIRDGLYNAEGSGQPNCRVAIHDEPSECLINWLPKHDGAVREKRP